LSQYPRRKTILSPEIRKKPQPRSPDRSRHSRNRPFSVLENVLGNAAHLRQRKLGGKHLANCRPAVNGVFRHLVIYRIFCVKSR